MSVWKALGRDPLRFLLSSWPWRSLAYLLTSLPIGLIWFAFTAALLFAGVLLTPVVVGIGLLFCVPMLAVGLADVERRRLRWLDPRPAPSPHRDPSRPGLRPLLRLRLREVATWRELGYGFLAAVLSVFDGIAAVVLVGWTVTLGIAPIVVGAGTAYQLGDFGTVSTQGGAWLLFVIAIVFAMVSAYLLTLIAGARAALARMLLVRPAEEELIAVTASRARMADAFEGERRRIERDLHDGAQQRLTGLIMTLGLAKLDADTALIGKAQDEARAALDELRDLVRGIHPSVLTDRGLGAAVASLAERSPVPVEVDVKLPERPPEAIETAAYFVIAEALTNVAKHSRASSARVLVRRLGTLLILEIHDDGHGGADPAHGSGLQGLADRVAVYDGALRVASPAGGPTIVRVEIPCG